MILRKISNLIHRYICSWGMNETIGPINPDVVDVFSECSSNEIFEQSRIIISQLERFTMKSAQKNIKDILLLLRKNY